MLLASKQKDQSFIDWSFIPRKTRAEQRSLRVEGDTAALPRRHDVGSHLRLGCWAFRSQSPQADLFLFMQENYLFYCYFLAHSTTLFYIVINYYFRGYY